MRSGGYRVTASQAVFIAGILILILFHIGIFGLSFYVFKQKLSRMPVDFHSVTAQVLLFCDVIVTMIITILAIFCGMKRIKRLMYIIRLIQEVNMNINYDGSLESKLWKVLTIVIICVAGTYTMVFLEVQLFSPKDDDVAIIFVLYYTVYIPPMLLVFQEIFLNIIVNSSLQFLNYRLKQVYLEQANDSGSQVNKAFSITKCLRKVNIEAGIHNIESIAEIEFLMIEGQPIYIARFAHSKLQDLYYSYRSINDIIALINNSEGDLLFLLIFAQLIYIMNTVYILYGTFSVITVQMRIPKLICQYLWLAFHCTKLLLLIEPNHHLIVEMEKTKDLFSVLMCRISLPRPLRKEIAYFFQHFKLNRSSYTPLGLFTCDRPLLATISGAVTSFLIIIMQFDLEA